jgi:hypothetical protein
MITKLTRISGPVKASQENWPASRILIYTRGILRVVAGNAGIARIGPGV